MVDSIKSLTRIKKTCVHWSVMFSVVLDHAFYSKNAHVSRMFCFKSKLVIRYICRISSGQISNSLDVAVTKAIGL